MNEDFKKELEELSSDLAKFREQHSVEPPELPANFFHNVQVEVLGKLREEMQPKPPAEKTNPVLNWVKQIFQPQISLALATGLILLAAGVFWMGQNRIETPAFAELSEEEILQYIGDNIDDFDAVSLTEMSEEELYFENDLEEEEVNRYLEENLDQMDETDFENLF